MEYILLAGLVAAVSLLVYARRRRSRKEVGRIVEDSRKRAQERYNARAFADTVPAFDPYRTGLEFQNAVSAVEVNDKYDATAELSQEQMDAISAIFKEHKDGKDITLKLRDIDLIQINVGDYSIAPVEDPWKNAS